MGSQLDIASDDPRRIKGAVYQVLLDALNGEGDTYVGVSELLTEASKLLQINQFDPIASCINSLQEAGKVIVDGENAALQNINQTEFDFDRLMLNFVN